MILLNARLYYLLIYRVIWELNFLLIVSSPALVHDLVLGIPAIQSLCRRMSTSKYLLAFPIESVIVPLVDDIFSAFSQLFNSLDIIRLSNARVNYFTMVACCFTMMVEYLSARAQVLVFISNLGLLSSSEIA